MQLIFLSATLLLSFILICSFLTPVSDELGWIQGGKSFFLALVELNPGQTYVNDVSHRLGVSVLWVSSLIYLILGSASSFVILIAHRLIFLLINLSLFGLALNILRKYSSLSALALFVLYIFLNRFFPILGRSSWLDQLLAGFTFLCLIFWVKYLFESRLKYFYLAVMFDGLALLTKYAGWFLPLVIVGLTFLFAFLNKVSFKKYLIPLFLFLFLSLGIFYILYPAMWVDPKKALFLRFQETIQSVSAAGILEYLKEFRLIDPVLILGTIFVGLDFLKKKKDLIFFLGLGGLLYLFFYIGSFLAAVFLDKANSPFLVGVYRYTFPAILPLAYVTFIRLPTYVKNKNLRVTLLLILFVREIIFSPILLF